MVQTQKKSRTKKEPNVATKQPSSEPGLFELFMGLVELLDEPYRTPAKKNSKYIILCNNCYVSNISNLVFYGSINRSTNWSTNKQQ